MQSPQSEPWFAKGDCDLAMARRQLDAEFYDDTAFHSQQAAEKYLKGLFIRLQGRWRRTHSCEGLLDDLSALGEVVPADLTTAAKRLDRHYAGSRYPNGLAAEGEYSRDVAEAALTTAEAIVGYVRASYAAPGAEGSRDRESAEAAERPGDGQAGVISRFAAALAATLPVKALVLFGSRARGDSDEESDYDFVVVSEAFHGQGFLERGRLPDDAWMASRAIRARRTREAHGSADILCVTPAELADLASPDLWDALEEGIPILDSGLWAAALTEFARLREAGILVPIEDGWQFKRDSP